jgi:hypothetical protein
MVESRDGPPGRYGRTDPELGHYGRSIELVRWRTVRGPTRGELRARSMEVVEERKRIQRSALDGLEDLIEVR